MAHHRALRPHPQAENLRQGSDWHVDHDGGGGAVFLGVRYSVFAYSLDAINRRARQHCRYQSSLTT